MREEESLAHAADGVGSAEDIVKMQKKHEVRRSTVSSICQ